MCVVSMISDHYMGRWPTPWKPTTPPLTPERPAAPTPQEYADYQELLRKAMEYDKLTGQKDCPAPAKLDWQKSLEEFMRKNYGLEPQGSLRARVKGT